MPPTMMNNQDHRYGKGVPAAKHHPYNYGEDDMVSANNQMMMTMGSGDDRDPHFEENKIQHLHSMQQNHHNLVDTTDPHHQSLKQSHN